MSSCSPPLDASIPFQCSKALLEAYDLDSGCDDPSEPAKIIVSQLQSLSLPQLLPAQVQATGSPSRIPINFDASDPELQGISSKPILPVGMQCKTPTELELQAAILRLQNEKLKIQIEQSWSAPCGWWPMAEPLPEQHWVAPWNHFWPDPAYWPQVGPTDMSEFQIWPQGPPGVHLDTACPPPCGDCLSSDDKAGKVGLDRSESVVFEDVSTTEDESITPAGGKAEELSTSEDESITPAGGKAEELSTSEDESITPAGGKAEELSTSEDESITPAGGKAEELSTSEDESITLAGGKAEEPSISEEECSNPESESTKAAGRARLEAASRHILDLLKPQMPCNEPDLLSVPPGLGLEGLGNDDEPLSITMEEQESKENRVDDWNDETYSPDSTLEGQEVVQDPSGVLLQLPPGLMEADDCWSSWLPDGAHSEEPGKKTNDVMTVEPTTPAMASSEDEHTSTEKCSSDSDIKDDTGGKQDVQERHTVIDEPSQFRNEISLLKADPSCSRSSALPEIQARCKQTRSEKRRRVRVNTPKHSERSSPTPCPSPCHDTPIDRDTCMSTSSRSPRQAAQNHLVSEPSRFLFSVSLCAIILFALFAFCLIPSRMQAAGRVSNGIAPGASHAWATVSPFEANNHLGAQRVASVVQNVDVETARGHAVATSVNGKLQQIKQGLKQKRRTGKQTESQSRDNWSRERWTAWRREREGLVYFD